MSIWRDYVWPTVAILSLLLLLPIIGPPLLIIYLYHVWLINKLAERSRPGEVMKQTDAIWYYDTRENPAYITTVWWMKGELNFEEWVQHVDKQLARAKHPDGRVIYPKLLATPRGVWRRFVWVPCDQIDIRKHVVLCDDKPAEDKLEVEYIVSEVASRELPKDLPQWQVVLIPLAYKCPNGDAQFVAVLRIHHAVGDGIALLRMILNHFIDKPPKSPPKEAQRYGTKTKLYMLAKACFSAPRVMLDVLLRPFDHNALHGPVLCGKKLFAWSEKINLERVKKIKNALGYTVNDILLGCLASSVAQYLRLAGKEVPQHMWVAIPVDVRRSKPGDNELDNQFALVFLKLPLQEKDRISTIRVGAVAACRPGLHLNIKTVIHGYRDSHVKDKTVMEIPIVETKLRMDAIKGSADAIVYSLGTKYLLGCLPIWLSKWIINVMSDTCSMPVSNVPGPQHLLTVSGVPVDQLAFWPPQKSKIGVSVSLMSYNGAITMGVSVDRNIMKRPRHLVEIFEKNMDDLAKDLRIVDDSVTMEEVNSSEC